MVNGTKATPKKRGRPKGSLNKKKVKPKMQPMTIEVKKQKGRPTQDGAPSIEELKASLNLENFPTIYKCTMCGMTTTNPRGRFYSVNNLDVFSGNDHYINLCGDCVNKLFDTLRARYDNERFALFVLCSLTGYYFCERLYDQMISKSDSFNIGIYIRTLNGIQYKGNTFVSNLVEMKDNEKLFMPREEALAFQETKWKAADRRNKSYVIQTLGYDCFENDDTYNDLDRKFLYNTLAAYLTDDVAEDPHKMQCVTGMVKSLWQIEKITKVINAMLVGRNPDESVISKLTLTKNSLQSAVNATAKENAISASGSGKRAKSNNSLTNIMKDMLNDGFDEVKANVSDAIMDEAYQHIASISARAISDELKLTGDDYAKMIAEQSEMVRTQQNALVEKDEEIRQLKVQISDMEKKAKYRSSKNVILPEEDGDVS